MKLRIKISDSVNHMASTLSDYWIDFEGLLSYPLSLGEQKQKVRRLIKKYCNNKEKELTICSVYPSVLEAVSECIKDKLINAEDIDLHVFHEVNSDGLSLDIYHFNDNGDLDGDFKLDKLINWLLH